MSLLVIGIVLDSGGEECVDKCSFAQARFASNLRESSGQQENQMIGTTDDVSDHDRKGSTPLGNDLMSLVG